MVDVVDADALAVCRAYLASVDSLVQAFGDGEAFTSDNEPPYPHCQITDTPGGSNRTMDWVTWQELTIETLGDLDGNPGKAALKRLHTLVLQALRDLPKQPQDGPVVTGMLFPGAHGYVPLPTGQPRYLSRVTVVIHP